MTDEPTPQSYPLRKIIITDREQQSGPLIVLAWVLALLTLLYLLPWAVAASRGKSNHDAIAAVNLLTGWTIVGWIAALVMACMPHQVAGYRLE